MKKSFAVPLAVAVAVASLMVALLVGSASARSASTPRTAQAAAAPLKMPVWLVTGKGATEEQANTLMDMLGTFDNGLQPDGTINYMDPEKFQGLPMMQYDGDAPKDEAGQDVDPEAIDLEALQAIEPVSDDTAMEIADGALAEAQLEPLDGARNVTKETQVQNSFFDVFSTDGASMAHVALDSHVDYSTFLGKRKFPLIGPGAQAKIVIDGDENATLVNLAFWHLRMGPNVRIITQAQATTRALNAYRSQCGRTDLRNTKLSSQVVYWAPPLSMDGVKRVVPHYSFEGTAQVGGQTVQLKQLLVAAPVGAPKVSISGNVTGGSTVNAKALVSGGAAPYSFRWTSCQTPLDPAESSKQSIRYQAGGRSPMKTENLMVEVTDANGLTARATRSFKVTRNLRVAAAAAPRQAASITITDVGASTGGTAIGLPGCLPDTAGFPARMALGGIPTAFHWTNFNSWEQDFKDPIFGGGDDSNFADNVDATFYCGHANGDGFTFPGAHTDTGLHFTEARWGNRDLEWLGIAACGPLQATSSGLQWWQRWGPSFQGLHLLAGYETTSFDVTTEGFLWADNMLGTFWWGSPMPVRSAWVSMAISAQPSSVRWAVMGVIGVSGLSNWNDFFWGKGPTGPDIPPSLQAGFWKISGPS